MIAREQLRELGLTERMVDVAMADGRLHRLHRGVYAVGHRKLDQNGRWLAAVLACGPDAVLSHRSAVALWKLRPAHAGPIDVSVLARGRPSRPGVTVHCVRALPSDERQRRDGIPVTTLDRTLLDYAEVADPQELRLVIDAADRRDLFDLRSLEALLARARGRRGLAALRNALAVSGPAPETRSELERQTLAFVRAHGIPEPQCNVLVHGVLVDCFWPQARLVVEVDSWLFHKSRTEFERDRRRDAKLTALGYRVIRITSRRLREEPARVAAELLTLLRGVA